MIKNIGASLKAIIAGYLFDVIGIIVVSGLLSFTPLKGSYWTYLVISMIFIIFGGYIAASVTRNYRFINAGFVGTIHILWALYMGGYSETLKIFIIQVLAIPLAVLGGIISKKKKPIIRDIEQI